MGKRSSLDYKVKQRIIMSPGNGKTGVEKRCKDDQKANSK